MTTLVTRGTPTNGPLGGDGDTGDPYPDRAKILELISSALETPPVGLVILEVHIEPAQIGGPLDEKLLQETVVQRVSKETGPADSVLTTGPNRLTIIKPGLSAPAEAEGFALRIHAELHLPMLIGQGRVSCQAAIGVAVSRTGDTAGPLVRFAEHALEDARLLGGDAVVAFDDQDRDLIIE